ncbi:MAG: hypothetical protein WCP35_01835 [Verrucomicrobiota bacterium]
MAIIFSANLASRAFFPSNFMKKSGRGQSASLSLAAIQCENGTMFCVWDFNWRWLPSRTDFLKYFKLLIING